MAIPGEGKFLTQFTRPKIWDGLPFSLSALIGDIEEDVSAVIEGHDIAGATLSTVTSTGAVFQNGVMAINIPLLYGSLTGVNYVNVWIKTIHEEVVSEVLRCDIVTPCANPVLLYWRNSLGGDAYWCFDFSQEYSYTYSGAKVKRMFLFAESITANEFVSIEECTTLGEAYEPALVELLSTTNKTSARVGQQVYTVDEDGVRTGVLVIPKENRTTTRNNKHRMTITIDYPETFTP